MATAFATISPATATVGANRTSQGRTRVGHISGLNTFIGLKAENHVVSLGVPVSPEKCFAKIVSSLRKRSKGKRGGALSATCSAVAEIFRIAAIMPGLVLVGVAVGFVLLRLETSLEEE
ncbi:hypothetical protein CDL12_18740 [Handroanthus impetiginosus]|uniref:Cytochrome b6-f complex subunit 7 n=1 Tax=Handroanthus impetiginosus TaxID=429701 RepID=A0A2G9GTX8_9LAMI|nr:hypothetical protein CDL12_18740 [Handroanthus impetiginosus]